MSILNRDNVIGIMDRISVATPDSCIAVFQHTTVTEDGVHQPDFEQLFDSTAATKARIKYNPVGYVGSFHNEMDMGKVAEFFNNYENQPMWEGV